MAHCQGDRIRARAEHAVQQGDQRILADGQERGTCIEMDGRATCSEVGPLHSVNTVRKGQIQMANSARVAWLTYDHCIATHRATRPRQPDQLSFRIGMSE